MFFLYIIPYLNTLYQYVSHPSILRKMWACRKKGKQYNNNIKENVGCMLSLNKSVVICY